MRRDSQNKKSMYDESFANKNQSAAFTLISLYSFVFCLRCLRHLSSYNTHTHNPNRVQVQFIFKPTMMIKIHILCLYLGEMRIPLLLFAKEQDTNKKNQIGLTPKKKQNMYLSLMIVPPETCHILD